MVNSKTSSAHKASIPRVLNIYDMLASYMKWYILQTLGELQCWESELCSQVPPELWLFFAVSMSDLGPLVTYACLKFRKSFYAQIKAIKEIH